ncbi:MAG: radical SAM protein [Denitrovibrio sp.]|nr:MAG: radical SAM protein [Denitrovibrio sp.]
MKSYTDKYKYLFGPVPSRRLGRSLGIDIIPHKICTMNCIYCEVGRTTSCIIERARYADADEIIAEFRDNYFELKSDLDIVTITGAGEPTLNLDLGYIIKEIKKISEHPVAVLTNSSLITDEGVRSELMYADVVVPSIDAATEEAYRKVCAPNQSLNIEEINEALISFTHEFKGRLLIEVLLCGGMNDSENELSKIANIIKRSKYDLVQLNTVHRPPAFSRAKTVSEKGLLEVALLFKYAGLNVEPVGNYIKELSTGELTAEQLIRLISMRPCSMVDISGVFGVDEQSVQTLLDAIDPDRLKVSEHNGDFFYFYI